jgi:hypothetical protein
MFHVRHKHIAFQVGITQPGVGGRTNRPEHFYNARLGNNVGESFPQADDATFHRLTAAHDTLILIEELPIWHQTRQRTNWDVVYEDLHSSSPSNDKNVSMTSQPISHSRSRI